MFDIREKNVLITGATSGIGKAAALKLSSLGANIYFIARNEKKAEDLAKEIENISGIIPYSIIADLSSQKEIKRAADEFKSLNIPLHILLNNAGLINMERKETVDGFEEVFALNHLAYYSLTLLLLDNIKNGSPDLYLFEIGNVFTQVKRGLSGIKETPLVSGLIYGNRVSLSAHESAKAASVFTIMGHMDRLCTYVGAVSPTYEEVEKAGYQKAFSVCLHSDEIGVIGTVDPTYVKDLGLEIDCAVHSFTLETDKLIPLLTNEQKFTSINVFPIMERDVDFVFSETVETGNVSTKILDQNYPNLTDVFPIDIFRHKSLGSDHKSVTFHFRFQHPDKTLEDKEVSSVINKIKRLVLSEFDAKLRSSN